MSILTSENPAASWLVARTGVRMQVGDARTRPLDFLAAPNTDDAAVELGFASPPCRSGTGSAGRRSSSCSAASPSTSDARTVCCSSALTLAAAAGNTARDDHPLARVARDPARAGPLLDLWCAGLIAFVALLVVDGGSNFALLLFLTAPFIAVVQVGWRRGFWLAVAAATCSVRRGARRRLRRRRRRCGSASSQPPSVVALAPGVARRSAERARRRPRADAGAGGEPPDQERPPDGGRSPPARASGRRGRGGLRRDGGADSLDRDRAPPPERVDRLASTAVRSCAASRPAHRCRCQVEAEPAGARPNHRTAARDRRQRARHERVSSTARRRSSLRLRSGLRRC